jgi:hypothetical protein
MKRVLPVIVIALSVALVIAARAQDNADYTNWMKQAEKANGSLRKELDAKEGDVAAADASKLAGIFDQVGQFWQNHNADDAVKFSTDAASSFRQASALASAAKFDEASVVLKSTQANCAGCHKAHRSFTLHGWKIK